MKFLIQTMSGNQLTARILRSTSWVLVGYGGAQAIRLASNLILTRILFPEAFGLMALVTVITVGLMMFSDVGIGPSISQSKRGDDPAFLNTAWTIQAMRGGGLWVITLLLAWPVAQFYDQPDLAIYLPIAGLALVITGFLPTRVETARRHLVLGRLTMLDLLAQLIGLSMMVVLALVTHSVLALVLGGIFSALAKLILTWRYLPGERNRFQLERAAVDEQLHFGKWIFLSTAFSFISAQGDKVILGKLLPLGILGVYNIGYFLASFPIMLGMTMAHQLMIPIFRDRPPGASIANRASLRRMRLAMSGGLFAMLATMAFAGPWLVDLLYDDRYGQAGAMIVLMACGFLPQVIGLSYDRAALAAGDSRGAFIFSGTRSLVQMFLLYTGFTHYGLIGGLVSYGIAMALVHAVLVGLALRHRAWDPVHDLGFGALACAITIGAVWVHFDVIAALSVLGG
ncbi:oligosaccharide flippase family protein [Pseudohalocynthiibacter aestuariivivens]|nr:oligosaccharide flippase family protein [Pseudohalocynthiibacter aestuariivivens]QIE44575.1 oligosaccharide flippase family protein [Pseudohalocynthiibacter aestuariivivens]